MFRVTRFCVQPFERRRSVLRTAEPQQFYSEGEAMQFARVARRRCVGLVVLRVEGWPVQNLWDRPSLLLTVGEVPPFWETLQPP